MKRAAITISIFSLAGSFAENKDIARDIRVKKIIPAFERGESIVLDFSNVDSSTQSFVHALISDPLRKYGLTALDRIAFKSCNKNIQNIIKIVVEYMQDGINNGEDMA